MKPFLPGRLDMKIHETYRNGDVEDKVIHLDLFFLGDFLGILPW